MVVSQQVFFSTIVQVTSSDRSMRLSWRHPAHRLALGGLPGHLLGLSYNRPPATRGPRRAVGLERAQAEQAQGVAGVQRQRHAVQRMQRVGWPRR